MITGRNPRADRAIHVDIWFGLSKYLPAMFVLERGLVALSFYLWPFSKFSLNTSGTWTMEVAVLS